MTSWLGRVWGGVVDAVRVAFGLRDVLDGHYDDKFHDIIRAYAQTLRCRIAGSPPAGGAQALLDGIDSTIAAIGDSKTAFARLCEIETRYFHQSDEPLRLAFANATRERFSRVASATAVAARTATGPPTLTLPWHDAMTADTIELLNYIHARYIFNLARETILAQQKSVMLLRVRRVGLGALVFAAAAALLWAFVNRFVPTLDAYPTFLFAISLTVLFLLGYLGSIVSVAQRIQRAVDDDVLRADPVFVIGGIAIGQRGIDLAMLTAGLFAVLLYFVFASGIAEQLGLSKGIFPMMVGAAECKRATAAWSAQVVDSLNLCATSDLFKMMLFAFVAGFSERLVPDVLNRITSVNKAKD